MPLVSPIGEQTLNYGAGGERSGRGLFLVPDSDNDLLGLVQELNGSSVKVSALFIVGDSGFVTEPVYIGETASFLISQIDQDAFAVYPEDGEFDAPPPIIVRADGSTGVYEGSLEDYPPAYRFNADGLLSFDFGSPVGQATQTRVEGGTASVYVADDGDGSGIFLRVIDRDGNVIGGVVRVNADISGDQNDPIVSRLDETFTVAWTQANDEGVSPEEYRATTYRVGNNLGLAIKADVGVVTLTGDAGDYVTDIFFYDTAVDGALGRDTISAFGANDIFVTTSPLEDRNGDGVIEFGRDRRLDLTDASGENLGEVAFARLRALEFDGVVEGSDGVTTYYVYSRVGSDADEFYLVI